MNLTQFPSITHAFFTSFVTVTSLDLLPSSQLNGYIFGSEGDEGEYEERFSELGYDSRNAIDNLGSLIYYLGFIVALIGVLKVLMRIGTALNMEKITNIGKKVG